MQITTAQTAGFCMGVRRAVEIVLKAPDRHEKPIFTFGPLIHNPQVLAILAEKGIESLDAIPEKGVGTVIIRAHGVPPEVQHQLRDAGFEVVNATCPRVIRVQTIIGKHAKKGDAVIIIGDADHPEVVGLLGHAGEKGHVVGSLEALAALPAFEKAIIVAQTTQNMVFFDAVSQWAQEHHPHYLIRNTICDSTARRQEEVAVLAENVDSIVVVGGRNSGNTLRLAEIARKSGRPTQHIELETELDSALLAQSRRVGITAGASTPNWMITQVFREIEKIPYSAKGRHWRRFFFEVRRVLLLTNIYLALGAGCLTFACANLQGIPDYGRFLLISMFYVFSMHTLNNLIGNKADRYNDPQQAHFYSRYRLALGLPAVIAGAGGLLAACYAGTGPFLLLLGLSLMGVSYRSRLIPGKLTGGRIRRLKDIPGAKTILITLAWGVVAVLLPALATGKGFSLNMVLVFYWSAGLVFARTAFFDITDMQGDRIVGKETIPLYLGEVKTRRLIKLFLALTAVVLVVSAVAGWMPFLAIWLTVCPAFLFWSLAANEKGRSLPGVRLRFRVETHFILAGLVTGIWLLIRQLFILLQG